MNFQDGRVYRILERFLDLVVLNLCWLIACLPVVTVWPATTALFAVVREWALGREPRVIGSFLRFFKANFTQSLCLGVLWSPFGLLLLFNLNLAAQSSPPWRLLLFFCFSTLGGVYLVASVYLFPVMSNYRVSFVQVIKNSIIFGVGQLPIAVLCLLLVGAVAALVVTLPPTLLVAGSSTAYAVYRLCDRAFRKVEAR
jgi:uncharacterized membrane protein YesL